MNFISSSIMQETVMFEPVSNRMYQPMKKFMKMLLHCFASYEQSDWLRHLRNYQY
jgi:hypothetical protein